MLVDRDKTKKGKGLGISDIIVNRTQDDRWPRILIFPQATTTRADCLTSFRTGGFRADSYVQGVALKYDIKPFCRCVDGLDVSWTNETPMLTVYLRLLLNCWNGLSVTWLPVRRSVNFPSLSSHTHTPNTDTRERRTDRLERSFQTETSKNSSGTDCERIGLSLHTTLLRGRETLVGDSSIV